MQFPVILSKITFLLIVLPGQSCHCTSGTKLKTQYNLPYIVSTRILLILSKFKPKTDDPISEIEKFATKLVKKSGVHTLFNGKETTNMARIPYKVQIKFPTYEQAKFYYLYAIAINCESKLEDWTCHYCHLIGRNVEVIDYQYSFYFGTKSYVAVNHDRREIVLCYQATVNLLGGLVDFRVVPAIIGNSRMDIKVHRGFRDATRAHFTRDIQMIKRLLDKVPNYKVIITGQSLGAGMAVIALFMIKYLNLLPQTEINLYCYGIPRIGNKAFVDFINQLNITAVRVVQSFDFTAHLLPAALEYYHFQNQMWIRDDGKGQNVQVTFCNRDFYEDPNCSVSLGFSFLTSFPPIIKSGIDHIMFFHVDPSKCYFERPLEPLLRFFWPLNNYVPPKILNKFPKFSLVGEIFSEIRDFAHNGIKELVQIASNPETYSDSKYELNLNKIVS